MVKSVREGRKQVKGYPRPGRPSTSSSEANIERIRARVLKNRRTTKEGCLVWGLIRSRGQEGLSQLGHHWRRGLGFMNLMWSSNLNAKTGSKQRNQKSMWRQCWFVFFESWWIFLRCSFAMSQSSFGSSSIGFGTRGRWILHYDNAPAHTSFVVVEFLGRNSITVTEHPPYSPDLASCDFFLFSKCGSHQGSNNMATEDFQRCYQQ